MSLQLTTRQSNILDFIRDRLEHAGQAPTLEEIGQAMGLANVSAVLGRYHEARALLDTARRAQSRSASSFNLMYSEAVEGIIDLQEGRMRQAGARFRMAVRSTRNGAYGQANGNAWAGGAG